MSMMVHLPEGIAHKKRQPTGGFTQQSVAPTIQRTEQHPGPYITISFVCLQANLY